MSDPDRQSLHQFLTGRYDLEGLRTLCFYLGVDYDNLDGRTRDSLARELILYLGRDGRLSELVEHQKMTETAFARESDLPEDRWTREGRRHRIFISHAHEDASFAHRLGADLQRAGHPVWIAPESILPGEQWLSAIGRGLKESSIFAVVLTPAGVASSWVEYETNLAISLERRGRMKVLLLEVAKCDAPFAWTGYQFIPFRGSYAAGLAELTRSSGISADSARVVEVATTNQKRRIHDKTDDVSRRVHEKTGIELIRIPPGPFLFGEYVEVEKSLMFPDMEVEDRRRIELPEFWIGRYPVTNVQYQRFIDATGHTAPSHWTNNAPPAEKLDHPVVYVTWHDVRAFCDWAGLRLPTEQEWEKAARGTDGRVWPWGNERVRDRANTKESRIYDTSPVGQFSPLGDSPFGCADMAGNVWEWVALPSQPDAESDILRGGAYIYDRKAARVTSRFQYRPNDIAKSLHLFGFRVATSTLFDG